MSLFPSPLRSWSVHNHAILKSREDKFYQLTPAQNVTDQCLSRIVAGIALISSLMKKSA